MTFGIDPELFVLKKGGKFATSVHKVPNWTEKRSSDMGGQGANPNPIEVWRKQDGFAFEFSSDPSTCRDYLVPAVATGIQDFYNDYPDYVLSAKASLPLTRASVQGNVPTGVCNYGCVPDQSAYTLEEKTAPGEEYHNNVRYTGGHIHWSFPAFNVDRHGNRRASMKTPPEDFKKFLSAAAALWSDIHVGVPMVAAIGFSNDYGEERRRAYYGQAGSHRVKPYGFEYRVLSGMLLASPYLFSWALGAMRSAFNQSEFVVLSKNQNQNYYDYKHPTADFINTQVAEWFDKYDLEDVRKIIDSHDVDKAREYVANTQYGYQKNFIKGMIEADKAGIGLNMNLGQSWRISHPIINHKYPGVEKLMGGRTTAVTKEQFPPKQIMAEVKAASGSTHTWAREE